MPEDRPGRLHHDARRQRRHQTGADAGGALPDLSSLPRTGSGALDEDLLAKYSISVQPAGNGGYYLYAPLNLVEDDLTGAKVAFSAQLLYQAPAAAWQPQQARLSWAVQVRNETYASPEEADKALAAGNGFGANKQTILHAYYSDFNLTGLDVREDRGVEMAIIYEDPATDPKVNEDDALVHLVNGLDRSFLLNRDCDFVDNDGACVGDGQRDITIPAIKARWDRLSNSGTTDGQRWGLPANRQPGVAGNQTRDTATDINFNETITAALCYGCDKDYYAFDGLVGQNVTIDLPVRPADYYISVFDPAGQYVTAIFPGSWLQYGDQFTLNVAGRWTLAVWDPNLVPTTNQYQLQLSVNTTCSGLDPYEPNNEEFSPYAASVAAVTLRTMLCETNDQDWFAFPMTVGDRIRITPRILTDGTNSNGETVNMNIVIAPPGGGSGEIREPYEYIASESGDFRVGIYTQPRVTENLAYEIDVEIIPPPARPTPPNNWTCSVYPSTDVPRGIEDLAILASTVNVTASGPVTWVGLNDFTLDHGGLYDVSFGLAAPDGSQVDLFAFDDYGFYVWCGEDAAQNPLNCQLSVDDWAIEGLAPPQFPNDGGTFRPSRNSFASFAGKASNGAWTLFVSDDGLSDPGGDGGDTTGDLFGWSLEVCIDNGLPPDPTPTPTPIACTPVVDPFEDDDTRQTASVFDIASSSSAGHTFDRVDDVDWQQIELTAGLQYTLTASVVDPAQRVTLSLFESDGVTHLRTEANRLSYTPSVSGDYYLRATSGSGLGVSLCRSGYSLVLVSRNPNAVPVPLPIGTPLPSGHARPPRSAAVLQPAAGTVLTQLQPIQIEVGLNAETIVQSASLFANGVSIGSYPTVQRAPAADDDLIWQTEWTPSQAGTYSLTVVITDNVNLTATSPVQDVYVDLANPVVGITAEAITLAKLTTDGAYLLHGTATDDSQVAKVEVRLDGGLWREAEVDGSGSWSLVLAPLALPNPDGGSVAVEAQATDKAGRTATASASMVVDVTLPAAFESTTTLISSGAIISPMLVTNELGARLAWPAIGGAASVYAGWTSSATPALGALTAYGAAAGSHDQTLPEAGAMYAHVVALDALGNQTAVSRGPYYFDSAPTPDLIADLVRDNWVDSGGKQVVQMATAERGVQKIFAGWNAQRLRLRWQGFDPDSDGDLYLYLSTGGSGSSDLYNPYGASQPGVLPFAADYLVRVSSGMTPTLYAFGGGTWIAQTELASLTNGAVTDLLLPFADLGIASPAGAALKVLGVASLAVRCLTATWDSPGSSTCSSTRWARASSRRLGCGPMPNSKSWSCPIRRQRSRWGQGMRST